MKTFFTGDLFLAVSLSFLLQSFSFSQCDKYKAPFLNSEFAFTNWQSEDGLPQNSVLSICQTPDGYIWFGTQKGVVRFDGMKFKLYGDSPTRTFSNNGVYSFAYTSDSVLWMGSQGNGLLKLKNGKFSPSLINSQLDSKNIISVFAGKDDILFISTESSVYSYKSGALRYLSHLPNSSLTFRVVDSNGDLLATSLSGKLYKIRESLAAEYKLAQLPAQRIFNLHKLSDTALLVLTNAGFYSVDNAGNSRELKSLRHIARTDVRSLCTDRSGNLWIGTMSNGLFSYKNNRLRHFTVINGLSHKFISSLFADESDNIWAGTLAAGVNKISKRKIRTISSADGLSSEFVFSVAEDKDRRLWLGTYGGGVVCYKDGIWNNLSARKAIGSNIIRAVFIDSKDNRYFGSYGGGISVYSGSNIKTFVKKDGLPDNFVYSIAESPNGSIWIGTANGIGILRDGIIRKLALPDKVKPAFVRYIVFDKSGSAWVCFDNMGICKISDTSFTLFSQLNGLPSNYIRSVYIDNDNAAWVCSGNGLSRIKDGRIFNFGQNEPLLNDLFYQCVPDDFGFFWLSSNTGVFRVKREDLNLLANGARKGITVTHFNKTDGMISSECNGGNSGCGIKTHSGSIIFPNLKGLVIINPAELLSQGNYPLLHFESISVDDRQMELTEQVVVPPGSSRIEIEYTALSFKDPEKIKFKYKLNSLDNSFLSLGNSRNVVFNHLPAGDYELILFSTNDAGEWNPSPARLAFTIKPYFYETKLFLYLILLLLFAAVFLTYRRRISVLKRKQTELQDIVNQRTQSLSETNIKLETAFAAEQQAKSELLKANELLREANETKTHLLNVAAHDLKNPLNAIRGFAQILREEITSSPDQVKMVSHIYSASTHMLDLINDLLKTSVLESGKIKLEITNFDVTVLLRRLLYRNRLIAREKQQEILANLPDELIIHADEFRTEEIFENLFSNAIKFTPQCGRITVSAEEKENFAEIRISDSGPGFTDADMKKVFGRFEKLSALPTGGETSTGLGLSIVKDLVKLQNGIVWVESGPGLGAIFCVHLPIFKVTPSERSCRN